MRPFVMTSLFFLTACGPEGTLEGAYEDCISLYEDAEEEVEDADDLEEFFNDLKDEDNKISAAMVMASTEIRLKVVQMDEEDREDYIKELADRLKDLDEDCDKAQEKFYETVGDDDDIAEEYGDWEEDRRKTFEDACEAAQDEEYGMGFACSG